METTSLITFLAIGALAGCLAGNIMKGRGFGVAGNIVVGVVGAVLGGFVFGMLGITAGGILGSIMMATIGAVLLLLITGLVKKSWPHHRWG
ncbi:MAG TPA: GlsB/YeaQ/YmgE family stress response membrane protein [Mariprofundaceae bacterium]|nr:GlsB/YeaQ/YmgE family stress response membrane protein [Mariprofundaceae bacterium]